MNNHRTMTAGEKLLIAFLILVLVMVWCEGWGSKLIEVEYDDEFIPEDEWWRK